MNKKINVLGSNIARLRKERKVRQGKLAEALDIGASSLSKYENGVSMPSAELVARMAKELKVPVEELYADISEGPRTPIPNSSSGPDLSGGLLGLEELMVYHGAVERLHRACGDDTDLKEPLDCIGEMLRKLEEQSHLLREARAQTRLLQELHGMVRRD